MNPIDHHEPYILMCLEEIGQAPHRQVKLYGRIDLEHVKPREYLFNKGVLILCLSLALLFMPAPS
jgi:hypothetical protein